MNRPSAREVAKARDLLKRNREARRADRKTRVEHKAEPIKASRGRVKDNAYLAYLRRQPCCVGPLMQDACQGGIDPAHIRFSDFRVGRLNPGVGNKSDDKWCLPVCRKHHEAQHQFGDERRWWSDVVRADVNALAAQHHADFLAGKDQGR